MMPQRKPNAMDGYVRVSRRMGREGPGYISKDVQREAIERWADYRGINIATWHVDEDESGGTQDRPGIVAALKRVEAGETDGIACWRLNRFARNVSEALRDVKRVQVAGGVLAFIEEDIDPTGPFGEFLLTVLLAVNALELNNFKAGWRSAKSRAIERGAHIGPTPFGYVRRDDGTLEIDPDRGPIVSEVFAIAARDGLDAAKTFLRAHVPERTWTAWTVRRFLGNHTYLGRVAYGDDLVCADAHGALVSRAIFERVKHVLEGRVIPRRAKGVFPLSGVAACGTCGGHMIGGRGGADKRRVYRCAGRCAQPATVSADPLEAYVVALLRDAFQHPGFRVGGDDNPAVATAEAALLEAEVLLDEFASNMETQKLLGHRYHHHLEQRVAAVDSGREQLRKAMSNSAAPRVVVPAELWDELEPAELAEVLRGGIETVLIDPGRRPLGERVRVVPKGMDRPVLASAQDAQ